MTFSPWNSFQSLIGKLKPPSLYNTLRAGAKMLTPCERKFWGRLEMSISQTFSISPNPPAFLHYQRFGKIKRTSAGAL